MKFKNGKVELDLNLSISNPKRMTLQFSRMEGDKQVELLGSPYWWLGVDVVEDIHIWEQSCVPLYRIFIESALSHTSCISCPAIIQFNMFSEFLKMTHSPSLSTSNSLLIGSVTVIKTKYHSYFDDYLGGVGGGGVAKNKAYVPLLLLTTTKLLNGLAS